MTGTTPVSLRVNGQPVELVVEPRHTLADVLRVDLGLTGTHLGCEQGACGACTVLLDRRAVRSCLVLAVQADGHDVATIEGLAGEDPTHPAQDAFVENRGFQCGFCTSGMIMGLVGAAEAAGRMTRDDVVETVSGHICRCTGYDAIVASGCSYLRAVGQLDGDPSEESP